MANYIRLNNYNSIYYSEIKNYYQLKIPPNKPPLSLLLRLLATLAVIIADVQRWYVLLFNLVHMIFIFHIHEEEV